MVQRPKRRITITNEPPREPKISNWKHHFPVIPGTTDTQAMLPPKKGIAGRRSSAWAVLINVVALCWFCCGRFWYRHSRKVDTHRPLRSRFQFLVRRQYYAEFRRKYTKINYNKQLRTLDTTPWMDGPPAYPVAIVRKRTIPTERPPLVGEVNANLCG
jgi:hypothetical protein